MQAAIGRIQLKNAKMAKEASKNANAILLTAQRSPKLWVPELSRVAVARSAITTAAAFMRTIKHTYL